jgi:hypothetical protein
MVKRWSIYYAGGLRVEGSGAAEWRAAPGTGVQVVVVHEPPPVPRPDRFATGYVHNGDAARTFYTGADTYDPFGWGVKLGSLIGDAEYHAIWERACGDR